ncbi:MAG: hypothetical protein IB618_02370 [Candidatus Pacearchaeota archaeon]|nr:MAG: hypothetical protein IB618_02370 [Candidatus Pacearchaeota archaeon]
MKSKQIVILIAILSIIIILAWFFWPSISEQTCEQKCKSLGYETGICRSHAVVPNMTICEENEISIGQTRDCTAVKKFGRVIYNVVIGVGKTCCCS